jgi:3-hydroxyacyl-CoA dehydrogenase
MSRLTTSTDLKKAVSNVDLVIEAIVENVDVKRKLFADIESVAQQ